MQDASLRRREHYHGVLVVQVFICKGFSGEILKMEIDPESVAGVQTTKVASKIFGWSGGDDSYTLVNLTKTFEYSPDDIIKENTSENDVLLVINSKNSSGC